jgi:D-sedoheptulose 7-phosphate isomerase
MNAEAGDMHETIRMHLEGHQQVLRRVAAELPGPIATAAELIVSALAGGGKLLVMGNGGSAADAQHFAAELVGRYRCERMALPAIALSTDTSILTAVGNDYGFDSIFSRQVEALARPGDVVFGISTSGRSPNVGKALVTARELGCTTIVLTGGDGGSVLSLADAAIMVPSEQTPWIQEAHLTIIHILCHLIERDSLSRNRQAPG